ncbi:MAG: tRNA epoxyqueuosine(34) reductase QueG, partial [Balneolaceae bacterium]
DICQDVCPWNSKAKLTQLLDFYPRQNVLNASDTHFQELNEESFNELFAGSAVRRTKWEGFERNLGIFKQSS